MDVYHRGRRVASIFLMQVSEGQKPSWREQWKLRAQVLANGGTWLHVLRFVVKNDTGPIYLYDESNSP